jgi:hypothetical protein
MVCGMAAEEQRVRQLSVVLSSVIFAQSSLFDGVTDALDAVP